MKNKKIITSIFLSIFLLLVFASCEPSKLNAYNVIQPNISGECLVIIAPSAGRTLKNILIYNNDEKVVFNAPELKQNKIILLAGGEYEFSAEGAVKKRFAILGDTKIIFDGKVFAEKTLAVPPAISFKSGQRWDITSQLREGASYHLAILDIDNLDEAALSYTAKITGNGLNKDIPLNSTKENNRIVSLTDHSFNEGTYTVTVSVNGNTTRIPSITFTVVPEPPGPMTIANVWNGNPLTYANVQVFRTKEKVNPELNRAEFDSFLSRNNNNTNLIKISGKDFTNSGNDGKIELSNVYNNEQIVIVLHGINVNDNVYTRTISGEKNKTITVTWPKGNGHGQIPSKGDDFVVKATVDEYSMESWYKVSDYSVSLYYRLGTPATISKDVVLSGGSGFTDIEVDYRSDSSNTIICFADLSNICKVSQMNYLLKVDDVYEGSFIMNNTIDGRSMVNGRLEKLR